jgi:hypothetical protein
LSHITRIKTKIVEKQFLLRALEDLGYQYEEGDLTISGFGANKTKADIRIKLRLSNDIGFRHTPQGYEIVADWWGVRGASQKDFTAHIMQRYAYHTTRAKLEKQGFSLIEETAKDGQIHLTLRRMA